MKPQKIETIKKLIYSYRNCNAKYGILLMQMRDEGIQFANVINEILNISEKMNKSEADKLIFYPLNSTPEELREFAIALSSLDSKIK